jgi:hypothetical protein
MPTLDEIRTITIQSKTDGVTQSTDEVNKLADSQSKLADTSAKATVVTDTQTRSHLSAQTALDRLRRQIDTNYASQQSMAKGQDVLTRAEQQGLITSTAHADLLGKLNEKYAVLTPSEVKFAEAASVVESRMVGMSASVGLVGEVLSVIGPSGLAAAAGIGAMAVAAVKLTESANQMGEWARHLQDTSDTIGLTTTQLQAFDAAADRVGVNADANAVAFERFAVNLGALKGGTGSLYTELEKVNPSLVNQLSVTKSNADAWNLLAKAYAQADAQQQALIAHAAFGKGGAAEGRVLTATNQAGGLGGLADQNAANAFTQQQIALWAQLRSEIATDSAEASRNIASIFTGPVLEAEAKFSSAWLDLSRSLRDFQPGAGWNSFVSNLAVAASHIPILTPFFLAARAYGSSQAGRGTETPATPQPSFDQRSGGMFPRGGPASSAGVQLADYKQLIAVLGAAATPTELLHEKMLQLNKDLADHPGLAAEVTRAQNELNESFNVQRLSAMVSALGAAATPAEHLTAATATLHLELDRGTISQTTYARAIVNTKQAYDLAISTGRERLALITDEELRVNALTDVQKAQADGFIKSAADMTTAQIVLGKSIRDTSDRMKELASLTPQLTRLGLDAGNFGKQLDTTATTSLSNLGTGMVDILDKTVDLQTGIHNLELQFIKSLLNMVVQMTVVAPIARSLSGLLGGFVPGGLSSPIAPSIAGPGGFAVGGAHSGAIVGSESSFTRYVHPAYFDTAPRFHTGGIAGDEVPILAKRGEGIFTPQQMAAMGGSTNVINAPITVQVQGGGTAADHQDQAQVIGDAIEVRLRALMRDEMANQSRSGGILRR